jgi:hypothetical protein
MNGTMNEKPEEHINISHDKKVIKPKKQKRKKGK